MFARTFFSRWSIGMVFVTIAMVGFAARAVAPSAPRLREWVVLPAPLEFAVGMIAMRSRPVIPVFRRQRASTPGAVDRRLAHSHLPLAGPFGRLVWLGRPSDPKV